MAVDRPAYLAVARVVAPWGSRGEVKVEVLTDFPERFAWTRQLYLGEGRPVALEGYRMQGDRFAILKLAGCDDRRAASALRGQLLQVPVEEAAPLAEGEYYFYQILGLEVWTTGGEHLGRVGEILSTGSNDVYLVRGERGEILLPAIAQVIRRIDLEEGRLIIEPMPGLW